MLLMCRLVVLFLATSFRDIARNVPLICVSFYCVQFCMYTVCVFWFFCFFWVFLVAFFPSVLWYCWLDLLTCKNCLPYNLYCDGGDVKPCSIQMNPIQFPFPFSVQRWWRAPWWTTFLVCVLMVLIRYIIGACSHCLYSWYFITLFVCY